MESSRGVGGSEERRLCVKALSGLGRLPAGRGETLGLFDGRGVEAARRQGLPDVFQVADVLHDLLDIPVIVHDGGLLLPGFILQVGHFPVQVADFHFVFGFVQGAFDLIQLIEVHCVQLPCRARRTEKGRDTVSKSCNFAPQAPPSASLLQTKPRSCHDANATSDPSCGHKPCNPSTSADRTQQG